MDQVIKFYRYFGFPVILNQKSSSSKLPIIWSSISLMWFTYHYGHLWACHYLYRIYAFIAGFPDDGQPDYRDVQYLLGRVLHISTEFVWPLSLKVYLLASYFFRGDSSFYHVIKRLNAAFGSFKAPSTIFNYMVSFIFVLLLIVTSAQIYFALGYMRYCVESADLCDMPYIIPWIDPAGELLDTITTQMGNTFLPLLSSMACLQFALCVKSIVSQKTLIINQLLIDRLVSLFDAQVGFNRHLQGWLFVLFSLYALDLITTVSLVARQLTKAATYSIIFLSVEFSSIALVCYSSSRAVESKKRLLDELARHRLKFESYRCRSTRTDQNRPAKLYWFDACLEHLQTCDLELTGADFFALNKSFILTLMGMCFTYAIILIQNH